MRKLGLLVLLLALVNCQSGSKRKKVITNPEKAPDYLRGRLPGKDWQQHAKPVFGSIFSMETITLKKCTIALYEEHRLIQAQQLKEKLLTGKDLLHETTLNSREGQWQLLTVEQQGIQLRLGLLQKKDVVFWSSYVCKDNDSLALYSQDFKRFLKEFWFLYRRG